MRAQPAHVNTTSVGRRRWQGSGWDEPAVGPGAIALTSEPEEHAVHENSGEEEHLIFEDFCNNLAFERDGKVGRTDDSRAGRKTKIFQVYSKPSYSPSRTGGCTNSSCVKLASGPKSSDAIVPMRNCQRLSPGQSG
jgi:hypothetical protein